jgi:iron complex outermembrane recepter protein
MNPMESSCPSRGQRVSSSPFLQFLSLLSRLRPAGLRPAVLLAALAVQVGMVHAPVAGQASQVTGEVHVTVRDAAGAPLTAATVRVEGTTLGGFTDATGVVRLAGVPAGEQVIRVERPGFRANEQRVAVSAGTSTAVGVVLQVAPMELGGIQVSVLRPDLRPELRLEEARLEETQTHDIGGVLRTLPGLDAIRRGGLGLDPVIRGLRDTQVGAYVDGMRTLPGGPGGMDTPLSHVDPSAVRGMEVVKGPYALTWGAGNMSAIRIETHPLPARGAAPLMGRMLLGYNSNLQALESGLELSGTTDPLAYTLSAAWRESGDYVSGSGTPTDAAFESGEIRGRVGLFASPASTLTLSGWYQAQRDIAYPGRPLNADWFDTWNASLNFAHAPAGGALRSLDATAYLYTVDHGMNNDGKPTALANPNRMPPFAMAIETLSRVEMLGGRASAEFAPGGGLVLEVGGDGYTALHQASSTNRNRDTGMLMMERLIWGDARLSHGGVFTRLGVPLGPVAASGTVRLDLVRADADSASAFFLENASGDLASSEANLSGALTLSVPVSTAWSLSGGVGSVVRSADANERFSDRAPSKRAQIGAEFIGDPGLRPERSSQLDVWVEATYPRWRGTLNVFAQRIDDHITIEETNLPRQSPMSAPTVFRYVNGDARYRGAEASATLALSPALSLFGAAAYLHGQDLTLDEPALGVSPLRGDAGIRWEPAQDGRFAEITGRAATRQDRVSSTRGEEETAGYTTVDLQGGMPLPGGFFLRVGVNNLLDAEVVNHLNARNPFSGLTVPEPGRVLFARLTARF